MSSPCLAGLLRPAVLLPEELPDVPLSAVLVHELAHLRRHDNVWGLLRHVMVALLYLQPLAWRLARKTEAAAEAVCDDYVVHFGGDREAYATTLVSLAELNLLPTSSAVVPLVTFRSLLGQRVTRILDRSRRLTVRLGLAALTLVVAGGLSAALLAGLMNPERQPTAGPTKQIDDANDTAATAEANIADAADKPMSDTGVTALPVDDDRVSVRGAVVDPAGGPLAGARVVVVRWRHEKKGQDSPLSETASDDAGNFEITYRKSQFAEDAGNPEPWRHAAIVALVPGRGPAWVYYSDLDPRKPATLRVVDDRPINGRIVDLEGKPVVGSTLSVLRIYRNEKEDLTRWIDAVRGGIPYFGSEKYDRPDLGLPVGALDLSKPIQSDQDGRFQFTGVGGNRSAVLKLSGGGVTVADLRVVTMDVKPFVVEFSDQPNSKWPITYYGADFEYGAEPSQPIEGIVRDAKSGAPLAGVRVIGDQLAGTKVSGVYATETLSDAQGRYRLQGMPKGEGNRLLAVPGDDIPYFMRGLGVPSAPGLEPVKLDIELHRGLWITGRLSEQRTGRPIQGHMYYLPWPDNPHIDGLPEFHQGHLSGSQMRYESNREGRFKLVGLPGRGLVATRVISRPYPPGQGVRAIADLPSRDVFRGVVGVFAPTEQFPTAVHEIRPADDAKEVDLDFQLDPGDELSVRFVDRQGQPLSNLWVRGLWPKSQHHAKERGGSEERMFALVPKERRMLLALDKERRLGKAAMISIADATDGVATVVLEPCATIKARLLDEHGEPLKGATVELRPEGEGDWALELPPAATDDNGLVNVTTVVPGCNYDIAVRSPTAGNSSVADKLVVAAGETVDLGEFDVTAKDRPEPKRTPAAQVAAEQKSTAVEESELVIRGTLLDPDGKPLAGGSVVAVAAYSRDGETKLLASTSSDASGQFELSFSKASAGDEVSDAWRRVRVVAVVAGFGPAWIECNELDTNAQASLKLAVDEPIQGRIVDLEGQPVVGAKVQVGSITREKNEDLTSWLEVLRNGETYSNSLRMAGSLQTLDCSTSPIAITAATDANGSFRIAGVGRHREARLHVSRAGVVSTDLTVVTTAMEPLIVRFGNPEPYFDRELTIFGATFQQAVEPSQPIVGKVVDAETETPLADIRLVAKKFAGKRMSEYGTSPVVSNERGEFRVDGMPRGD